MEPIATVTIAPIPRAAVLDIPVAPAVVNHPALAATLEFAAALPITTEEDAAPQKG